MTGYDTIEVTPSDGPVGATISGVEIADATDAQIAEMRRAFAEHGVVFFRDQHLSPDDHLAFAERWGTINVNRFFKPVDGYPRIAEVRKEPDQRTNIGEQWHTDHSYDQIPATGSILLARDVPPSGGDTRFASMYSAYEALSSGMKETLLSLRAEHTSREAFGAKAYATQNADEFDARLGNPDKATQDATHPVVIAHPLSGRAALYVNPDFTIRFAGWTREESAPLLEFLFTHAVKDEFVTRFQWDEGSVAIWDNRATQHSAANDYQGHRRLMHRITLEGVALEPFASA